MSKELSPLEALDELYKSNENNYFYKKHYDIIANALVDYGHFNTLYMPSLKKGYTLQEMEKSLKALEILKNKTYYTQTLLVRTPNVCKNSNDLIFEDVSDEELNLLKEVLTNE